MSIRLLNIFVLILIVSLSEPTQQSSCGGLYSYENGVIETPNYPNSYPQHMICKWNISVAQNHSILLAFEDFYTDKSDFLNVYDVINDKLFVRGRFSGLNHPKHLISTENHLFMNISTTSPRKGFKLHYETVNRCGGKHEALVEVVSSPGYPKRYFEGSNCNWTIICAENRTIKIKYKDIHMENKHSFLTIFDANLSLLANLTGTETHNVVFSGSNKLFLNFTTDNSTNSREFRGFSLVYTSLIVGCELPFIISASNAMITTNRKQTIDNIIYNSVNEYTIVDYDIHKRRLILFDSELNLLFANNSMDSGITINARSDTIAFHYIQDFVFWIDIRSKTINVMDSNDFNLNIYSICNLSGGNQRDLVINVETSELVWSEIGPEPKLWHINLDGSNKTVLYSNSRQAFHLTVDYENKRYYFVDIVDFSLFSLDFKGGQETYFMTSRSFFDSIISMSFHKNHLYLANNRIIFRIPDLNLKIKRAEILYRSYGRHQFNESQDFYDFKSLDINRQKIFGFKIIDSLLQPNFSNQCLKSKCDTLCLPNAQSYRCLENLLPSYNEKNDQAPIIMNSSCSGITLAIFNSVIILILAVVIIYLYFRHMDVVFDQKIVQVIQPSVSYRKSKDHEYENHDYEEPVFKNDL